jgi:hypothetical protein
MYHVAEYECIPGVKNAINLNDWAAQVDWIETLGLNEPKHSQ